MSEPRHILTIDLGTSGPKVALFTTDGDYVDGEFEPVELVLIGRSGVEQRPDDWWNGVVAATQRLWERRPVDPDTVDAVSVTSQWSGTVPVDAAGAALHNAVIWMDSRGAEAVSELFGGRINVAGYDPRLVKRWIQITAGLPSLSGKDPVGHILWLQQNQPEVARETAVYLEPKDYLNLRLTGRAVATFDSIVLHWLTDNRDWHRIDYVPELLEVTGISRAQLPDLIAATDVVGPMLDHVAAELGVPAGTPVIGGTPDVQSATIGSGAVGVGEGHLYLGTSSWLTCHLERKKTDLLNGIASLPSPLPGRYFVANEQETAGACLNWLRDNVLYPRDVLDTPAPPADVYQRIDALAATAPAGANGVIFTPWLNGERTPLEDHTLRAGWFNLGLGSTRADQTRAVLEGVAHNSRWLCSVVEKFLGKPFPWLHLIGGGASSDLWCQIHADVLGREIRQVENPVRANARGAALLASLALGRIGADDLGRKVKVLRSYQPNPSNRSLYDDAHREFRALYKQNKGTYRRLNQAH